MLRRSPSAHLNIFCEHFQNKKKKTESQKHKQGQGQINDQARKMQRQNEKLENKDIFLFFLHEIHLSTQTEK